MALRLFSRHDKKIKESVKFTIKMILGFSILFLLFYKVGFEDVYIALRSISPYYISLFLVFYTISILIGAWNIKILLDLYRESPSFLKVLRYYFYSWCFSMFVPGKIGEFSIIYFLKKDNIPLGRGLAITLVDKYITFFIYCIFSLFFVLIFFDTEKTIFLAIAVAVITSVTLALILSRTVRSFIKRYILKKYAEKFKKFSSTMFDYIRDGKKIIILDTIVTVIRLAMYAAKTYVIFLALGANVPFVYIMMVYSITSIGILVLPITVGGTGVRQAVGMFFFMMIGVSSVAIMGSYAIALAVNYILASIGCIYFLFLSKQKLNDENQNNSESVPELQVKS